RVAALWPQREDCRQLGTNVFLIVGVRLQVGHPPLPEGPPAVAPAAPPVHPPAPVSAPPALRADHVDRCLGAEVGEEFGEECPYQFERHGERVYELCREKRYTEALDEANRLHELARRHGGDNHPLRAAALTTLARTYQFLGQISPAAAYYQQALEIARTALGESHPDFAVGLHNLALLYRELGDPQAALPLARQSLAVFRTALGDRHPDLAVSLANLASLQHELADLDAAEPLYVWLLALRQTVLDDDHPEVAEIRCLHAELRHARASGAPAPPRQGGWPPVPADPTAEAATSAAATETDPSMDLPGQEQALGVPPSSAETLQESAVPEEDGAIAAEEEQIVAAGPQERAGDRERGEEMDVSPATDSSAV